MAKHKHKKKSSRKKTQHKKDNPPFKRETEKDQNLTKELMEFQKGVHSGPLPVGKDKTPFKRLEEINLLPLSPGKGRRARMGESAKLAEQVAKTGELTEKDLERPKRKGILETLKGLRNRARGKKKKKKEKEKE